MIILKKESRRTILCMLLTLFALGWATTSVHSESPPDIPKVAWPDGASAFCQKLLNACFRVCFLSRIKERKPPYSAKLIAEEKYTCYERCSNMPQLEKYCKMKKKDLLAQENKLVRDKQKRIKEQQKLIQQYQRRRQQLEKQAEMEKRWRERLQNERQRMMLQLRRELKRRSQTQNELKKDDKKLQLQRQRLTQQQREMKELRQQLKQQASLLHKQGKRIAKAEKRQLAEEKKRLALKQRLAKEEQKRLAIKQRLKTERSRREAMRQAMQQKYITRLEKLRQQRLKELDELKKQRQKEKSRLKELRKVLEKERELNRKHDNLAKMQRKAKSDKRQRALLRKLKKMQRQLARQQRLLRRRRKRLSRGEKRRKKARQQRLRRLRRLQRRARRMRRRRQREATDPETLYTKGKLAKVIQHYQKKKRPAMVRKIQTFQRTYRQGTEYHNANNHKRAIPMLGQAFTLDMELSGGKKSRYSKPIRLMLANMYYAKGELTLDRLSYSLARVYYGRALHYTPNHKLALARVKKLRNLARRYYQDAQKKQKDEPTYARKLMRKALRLLSRKDPLYNKIRVAMRQ